MKWQDHLAADEAAEPPGHGLPGTEVDRQHAPRAAGAGEVAQGIEDLAQIHLGFASACGGLGQKGRDLLPFRIGQVARVTPPRLESGLVGTVFSCPHPLRRLLNSSRSNRHAHSQTGTKDPDRWSHEGVLRRMTSITTSAASWPTVQLGDVIADLENGWSPKCLDRPAQSGEWGVLKPGAVSFGIFDQEENKALPSSLKPRPSL